MLVATEKNYPGTPAKIIWLQNGTHALCSPQWLKILSQFHWYAKKSFHCWYACSKRVKDGKVIFLRMHRLVAKTPPGLVCHHINGNSLDNRVDNLLNITEYEHAKYFSYR